MANPEHVAILKQGVEVWNRWRAENPDVIPDLNGANLEKVQLREINLEGSTIVEANLREAMIFESQLMRVNFENSDLSNTNFWGSELTSANLKYTKLARAQFITANLSLSDFSYADLCGAVLMGANLTATKLNHAKILNANFIGAQLVWAHLDYADLRGSTLRNVQLGGSSLSYANLSNTNLLGVNFSNSDLTGAILRNANLSWANFNRANLQDADLRDSNLSEASIIETILTGADISKCRVYGISVWNAEVDALKQTDLIINRDYEPEIRVDDLEVAQFIYLLLNNQKLRNVIDTLTTKAVLILGRFTDERKAVLDAIREELRKQGYLPILFDFEKPNNRDLTETVATLASLARFVIADLSAPNSIPAELMSFAQTYLSVPIQGIFCVTEGHATPYPMYEHLRRYPHVLPIYEYQTLEGLMDRLNEDVIRPAEVMFESIQGQPRQKS